MYHPVKIEKLSENQLRRLRNGHSVRVKIGAHHTIHLSEPQIKKLHSAHKHGKASTIVFDPYQIEHHGTGFFGDISTKAKQFIQKHHLQNIVNPVIHGVRNAGHRTVGRLTHAGHHAVNRLSHHAKSHLDKLQPIEGSGIFGGILNGAAGLSNLIGGNGSKEAADVLNGIGGVANFMGLGVARKHTITKRRTRKSKKGSGFVDDLARGAKSLGKTVATAGLDYGTNYLKDQINGLGVKPARKYHGGTGEGMRRRHHRKISGASLYPAGYS
jgi:hypothetical protein